MLFSAYGLCFRKDGIDVPRPRRHLEVTCWPVGQGLFTTAEFGMEEGGRLRVVYDCGSETWRRSNGPVFAEKGVAQ
jgi:hypothetical protein